MFILNASTTVKSIMQSNGQLISIEPGKVSQIIIASRNVIISAIKMGSPDEVGLILNGSFEVEVAKTITAAIPYLYTDIDEAKAKLLKADVDYKGNLNAAKINLATEAELKKKDEEIKKLTAQVKDLIDQLANANDLNKIKTDLQTRLEDAESNLVKVKSANTKLDTQLKDSQDSIESLTNKCNDLQKSNGSMSQELIGLNKAVEDLTAEKKQLTDELDILKSNSSSSIEDADKLQKQIEDLTSKLEDSVKAEAAANDKVTALNKSNEELKSNLEDASKTIDNMKSEFNKACEKFQITKDEDGNWIQLNA